MSGGSNLSDGSYGSIKLRDYQLDAVNFITTSLEDNRVPIVEMPTGSGKTIVAIISAITYAKSHGKKVLYLSRTNSQQDQVLRELRILSKTMNFKAMAMQGRINLCPLYMEMEGEAEFSPESLSKMCSARKKRSREKKEGGCRYYNDGIKSEETKDMVLNSLFNPKDLFTSLSSKTICPYESLKYAMRDADLVVMPYAYFVNSNMALTTIYNWRSSRENILLVIDEAHNLPEIARESNSMKITMHMVDLSEKEVINEGDPELLPGIHSSDFTEGIREAIIESGRVLTDGREEKRIMFREIFDNLVMYLRRNPEDVEYLLDSLMTLGLGVEERLEQKGRVPLSHAKSLAEKLKFMRMGEDNQYICTVSRDKDLLIEAYCLDPSIMLEPMLQSQSIHLSATISPIELYTNITGISSYSFKVIENVFPPENLLTIYSKKFTTKYTELDAHMIALYGEEIKRITEENRLKTIVFFPSFNTLRRIENIMPEFNHISEYQGINQIELNRMLDAFKGDTNVMFAVMGGRVSEGVNLPGHLLEMVILCGIPFPKPTLKQKALSAYYDMHFGAGWEYAFLGPAITKVRQAIGRVIRSQEDRGIAVIMDSRAEMLIPHVRATLSEDISKDIHNFLEKIVK